MHSSSAQTSRLFTPGPVEVPARVREAMARPLIHHRTPEFTELLGTTCERLRPVFGTHRPVHLVAASGTGGLETVLINLVAPDELVLTVEAGKFGQRWGKIASAFGIRHVPYAIEWGSAPTAEGLARALAENDTTAVVCITHSETSTGVLCDLEGLARVATDHGCRVLVDCITSACAHSIEMDAWSLDAVVGGSQKGFMLPPGVSMIAVSEAAEAQVERSRAPRYYFDLAAIMRSSAKTSTPYTPAISLVVGLAESMAMLEEEGLPAVFARHATVAQATRDAFAAMGLELFAERPSNIVSVARVPEGLDGDAIRGDLEARFGVKIAGGQEHLKGRIWRFGHLGYVASTDLLGALAAFERVLLDHGHRFEPGAGVARASAHFAQPAAVETAGPA